MTFNVNCSRNSTNIIMTNHYVTSIVVEVGQEAEGEGPPEVTEPEELGLLVILVDWPATQLNLCLAFYINTTRKSTWMILDIVIAIV